MNNNEKRWIVLLVAVVIIAVVLIVALNMNKGDENTTDNGQAQGEVQVNEPKYTTELADGTTINTSEDFNTTKTYGNLEITNIQYTEKNNVTVLLADVKNNGTTRHEREVVKITILGENNEVITETYPIIENIEPGATVQLNASIMADVSDAKDFKIEAAQ